MKNTSRKPYIYKVTNCENHQYYIGSQCSGKTIGVNYFTSSTNKAFKDGFKTYGEEKYKIEIVKEFEDPDECVHAENYMIRDHMQLKDGLCLNRFYCCSNEKIFSRAGTHLPDETRKKMSEAHKGTHHSEETRKKMSIVRKGRPGYNKGLHHSEEAKQKISRARKGHPGYNKGLHHSEETRKKMSIAKKGRPAKNQIKISIEGEVFNSLTEASKYYNVYPSTISLWAKNKKHNVVYV